MEWRKLFKRKEKPSRKNVETPCHKCKFVQESQRTVSIFPNGPPMCIAAYDAYGSTLSVYEARAIDEECPCFERKEVAQ